MIFEKCTKVKELLLINCKIGKLDKKFKIPSGKKYALTSLDLYWSASKDEDHLIDEAKAKIFFKALANSKLTGTLKNIHACSQDFTQSDLQKIVRGSGLNAKVSCDKTCPTPEH